MLKSLKNFRDFLSKILINFMERIYHLWIFLMFFNDRWAFLETQEMFECFENVLNCHFKLLFHILSIFNLQCNTAVNVIYLFWCTTCWHQQFSSQDLISTEYSVAYSNYEPTNSSLPPSDSQTSLHSASQLATAANVNLGPNRHSTVLNVTDPRFSATYGNPYLRSDMQQTVILN